MSSLCQYILNQNGPVAPYTLQTVFNISLDNVYFELKKPENNLIVKTKLGYFVHKFVLLITSIDNLLKENWMVHVQDLEEIARDKKFLDYLHKSYVKDTKNAKLFLFALDNAQCVKRNTEYNIFNIQSLKAVATKHGFGGLNIEKIFAEYDNAFEDVEKLVETNALIATKTRVYCSSLAALP